MRYKLFANIKVVFGANMATMLDLGSTKIYHIPKGLGLIIGNKSGFQYLDFAGLVDDCEDFWNALLTENLITSIDNKGLIDLDYIFSSPERISHAIIDISNHTFFDAGLIQQSLADLGVKHVQLRFFSANVFDHLNSILECAEFNELSIVSYEVMFNCYQNDIELDCLLTIISKYNRLRTVVVFYLDKIPEINRAKFRFTLTFVLGRLSSEKECGIICKEYFMVNGKIYFESLAYNSCLHKKISIDVNGEIKNCPSMPQSFGNIKDTTLEEALSHPDFQKYWNVTKDMVEVCKDCEFRYVCTDCRAYTERTTFKDDLDLSKPLKCGYNPYTNEWAEWSTNPLKQQAIKFYGMEDLVEKDDK